MERVIYLTIGLPGSGKTLIANSISRKTGANIICRDDIRVELFFDNVTPTHWSQYDFYPADEKKVLDQAIGQFERLRDCKNDLIIADSNLSKSRRQMWIDLSKGTQVKFLDLRYIPLELCIERDSYRSYGKVGCERIKEMYEKFNLIKYSEVN